VKAIGLILYSVLWSLVAFFWVKCIQLPFGWTREFVELASMVSLCVVSIRMVYFLDALIPLRRAGGGA
jgi:hypothetical protein